ncbi:MAG: glucosaminidase domain-containing protein [Treponema sp.]|nr:glucosaminidase domain-containing protein [Treponema sp.]
MRQSKGLFFTVLTLFSVLLLAGCVSLGRRQPVSRNLSDPAIKSRNQLVKFFMRQNPEADKKQVKRLAEYYIEECLTEGINSDCAFVQMCLETGFLRFGNLVTPEMHNYCGLGAIDEDHRGESFATEQLGVRAHIQHLHAYATTEDIQLVNELIDNRYKWVQPRGKAPTVFELAGTWAADREYGNKLDALLSRLEQF